MGRHWWALGMTFLWEMEMTLAGLFNDYGGRRAMGTTMEGYGDDTGGLWGFNWRAMGMTMEGDDYGGLRERMI